MSSDRGLYDEGVFMIKTKESSKPLSWILDLQAHESCMACGDKPNVSKHVERVDVENDLFGINRKLSNDPKMKYQKSEEIATQLNYSPAYLCERNITHTSFLETKSNNSYMENLRKLSPEDLRKEQSTPALDRLVNYAEKVNINTSNEV